MIDLKKYENWIFCLLLASAFSLALFIRVVLPYDSVFVGNLVIFGGNDPWYNMRLVENTLHNFPHRIWFDPYTYFPRGSHVVFAPLFDYLLAVLIWVTGRGDPYTVLGEHGINVIGAYYPAILGAMTVIPVYFIGRYAWNRRAGVAAAFLIAVMPGQFLSRSLLGFTDHHVMETLLSTVAIFFFIMALKTVKENGIRIASTKTILEKQMNLLKPMSYTVFSGIALGLYFLSWIGAPLIVALLITYLIVQYIICNLRNEQTDHLAIVAIPTFLIAFLMILPCPYLNNLANVQSASLIAGIVLVVALEALSKVVKMKTESNAAFPIVLAFLSMGILAVLNSTNVLAVQQIVESIRGNTASMTTIAECHPISWNQIKEWFSTTFFIALAAIPILAIRYLKKGKECDLFVLIWAIFAIALCFQQNRMAAYAAIPIALLVGYLASEATIMLDYNHNKEQSKKRRIKGKGKTIGNNNEPKRQKVVMQGLVLLVIIVIAFVPVFQLSLRTASGSGGPNSDWYNSLVWMRYNTPDTGLDYYAIYEDVPVYEVAQNRPAYDYPETAYSVMSWWDYGHWITTIARRIPVANPFQQGIGGPYKPCNEGAATFFMSLDEQEANEIADDLGVRYVVTDFMMADIWGRVYDKFGAMTVWADDTGNFIQQINHNGTIENVPSAKYWSTTIARLHILDGTAYPLDDTKTIMPMMHYRLIHESEHSIGEYMGRDLRFVKVFEYVAGAKVSGVVPMNDTIVLISTNVTVNDQRTFAYSVFSVVDDTYSFTLPYSTEAKVYDVFAEPYRCRIGHFENDTVSWDESYTFNITEEAVIGGLGV